MPSLFRNFTIRIRNLDNYFLLSKQARTRKHKYIPFIRWYLIPDALPLEGENNWDAFRSRIKKEFPIQWLFRYKIPELYSDYIHYPVYSLYWKYEEKIKDSNRNLRKVIPYKYSNPIEIIENIAYYYFNKYVLYSSKLESNEKGFYKKKRNIDRLSNFKGVDAFQEHFKENFDPGSYLLEKENLGNKTPAEYYRHVQNTTCLNEMTEVFQWFKFEKKQINDRMEDLWKEVEKNKGNFNLNSTIYDELSVLERQFDRQSLRVSFLVFKNHEWF